MPRAISAATAATHYGQRCIVCLFGLHGVLGDDWRAIGADALPDDALPVKALARCEATS